MNAIARFHPDPRAHATTRLGLARRFDRHPYVAAADRSQCFDCVTLMNLLTGADVDAQWMRDGGRLPFDEIAPVDALPGDLITFRMPWEQCPHHVALLTRGDGVDDPYAQIFGPWYGHAAATCWLRAWRPHVTGAWRIAGAA